MKGNVCPILSLAAHDGATCLRGACAWWTGIECAIVTIAAALEELTRGS